ncbi:FAD-dependent oxidoreductase [uncultured Hydrogenophaga sp.]|uniref:FAD-dependent oxidoreductase n=1 Tax=uncultured Hydrogenophaga sp. TaxID=199683 RepID=UPI00265E3158|nr:FAD-dependent oxidoreductase [uncultured Hydrogenophaga sp.]
MTDPQRHATVVGAGLAGAALAHALMARGWRVELLDAADGPARGASALPVGMLSPHVTRAPTPLSRLTALGVTTTREQLETLVPPGAGWQACEVHNHGHDRGVWPAALVRPGALVAAWIASGQASGRLATRWNAPAARLVKETGGWSVQDAQGQALARSPVVAVTGAVGSLPLLASGGLPPEWLPLRPVQGQMSLGELVGPALADGPQRDNGVYVPEYADSGLAPDWPVRIWSMGSTYERGATHTDIRDAAHLNNLESLRALNPAASDAFERAKASGDLLGWANVRCASLDRLPLCGALPDAAALLTEQSRPERRRWRPGPADTPRLHGLFTLCALGSRGLTLAAWCAQRLAEQIDGAAVQAEPDLWAAVDPARFAWRQARRGSS